MAATATTIETESTSPWLADFERNVPGHSGEPAALRDLRRQAIERFGEIGFPTTRQEQWRATNVAPIARTAFRQADPVPKTPIDPAALAPHAWEAAATLVFVDGRFAPALSRREELPAGVFAGSLAEALETNPAEVMTGLGGQASFAEHAFVALNTAFFADGAFLWLPRGVVIDRPIHLLFLASGTGDTPVASFPRNRIVAGESSQVRVVETYAAVSGVSADGTYLTCPVTEIEAGPNSIVDHYKVQRESHAAFHIATFALRQERSSALSSHSISLGGGLVRNDVNALLDGEGSDTILNGLYMIGGRQFVDNHMRVEHAKPHCTSHELFKGVLDGHARSVFNGLIHVRHGAQKTDAKQSNRNLLLSKDAVANSNPQLEIFADDVKCTHGSTVGQLDDDAIFYLRSRGIGAEAARSLLTYAFASDIVERIKVEPVRKDLEEFLFTALPKGEVVRQAV
jgi:Fe-S cluster assembly protein SufD